MLEIVHLRRSCAVHSYQDMSLTFSYNAQPSLAYAKYKGLSEESIDNHDCFQKYLRYHDE